MFLFWKLKSSRIFYLISNHNLYMIVKDYISNPHNSIILLILKQYAITYGYLGVTLCTVAIEVILLMLLSYVTVMYTKINTIANCIFSICLPWFFSDNIYEVALGVSSNTRSVIRLNQLTNPAVNIDTPGIVSCDEYRFFWIRWKDYRWERNLILCQL